MAGPNETGDGDSPQEEVNDVVTTSTGEHEALPTEAGPEVSDQCVASADGVVGIVPQAFDYERAAANPNIDTLDEPASKRDAA